MQIDIYVYYGQIQRINIIESQHRTTRWIGSLGRKYEAVVVGHFRFIVVCTFLNVELFSFSSPNDDDEWRVSRSSRSSVPSGDKREILLSYCVCRVISYFYCEQDYEGRRFVLLADMAGQATENKT